MNLLLLDPEEVDGDRATVTGRRAEHLTRVLGVRPGDAVRAGLVRGPMGTARVERMGPSDAPNSAASPSPAPPCVTLRLDLTCPPPSPPPCDLILALPRPKVLRRLLRDVASVGVRRLDLVNTWRVERSYFQSPALRPEALEADLRLGAEQGGTTWIPEVGVHRLLMPFLDARYPEGRAASGAPQPLLLVAQPGAPQSLESVLARAHTTPALDAAASAPQAIVAAVGPEGGFIAQEIDTLAARGFVPVHLGKPVLSVGSAVLWLLAKLDASLGLWQPMGAGTPGPRRAAGPA